MGNTHSWGILHQLLQLRIVSQSFCLKALHFAPNMPRLTILENFAFKKTINSSQVMGLVGLSRKSWRSPRTEPLSLWEPKHQKHWGLKTRIRKDIIMNFLHTSTSHSKVPSDLPTPPLDNIFNTFSRSVSESCLSSTLISVQVRLRTAPEILVLGGDMATFWTGTGIWQ